MDNQYQGIPLFSDVVRGGGKLQSSDGVVLAKWKSEEDKFTSLVDKYLEKNRSKMELLLDVVDENSCQCKIHERGVCNDLNGVGCERDPYGRMPAIRNIYERDVFRCHSEVGQRVLDVRAARSAVNIPAICSYMGGDYKPISIFVTGSYTHPSFLGSGYCYTRAFVPEARVRAARILGRDPYVLDVMRLMRVFGSGDLETSVDVSMVKPGFLHLKEGGDVKTGYSLMDRFLHLLRAHGNDVRVGSDEPASNLVRQMEELMSRMEDLTGKKFRVVASSSVEQPEAVEVMSADAAVIVKTLRLTKQFSSKYEKVRDWFKDLIDIPDICGVYIHYMFSDPVTRCVNLGFLKDRMSTYAVFGDAILTQMVVKQCLVKDYSPAHSSAARQKFTSNKNLYDVFVDSELCRLHDIPPEMATVRIYADTLEMLIGVIHMFVGVDECYKVIHYLFKFNDL